MIKGKKAGNTPIGINVLEVNLITGAHAV